MNTSPLFLNYPLSVAIISMIIAQVIKFPLDIILNKRIYPLIMFNNGGMPSSHSAMVTSLAAAIGLREGFASSYFAIATVFALVTMWDAAGIRYQASEHARILNILVQDVQNLVEHLKYKTKWKHTPLKELLGHKPIEVLVGAILGIVVSLTLY